MKLLKPLALALILLLLMQCKKDEKTSTINEDNDTISLKKDTIIQQEIHEDLYGIYTGEFLGKEKHVSDYDGSEYTTGDYRRISLKINRITEDSVYGQSIVDGNQRPFQGVFNKNKNSFVLDEPGSDKSDGRFEVKVQGDSMTGSWTVFDKSAVKIPQKTLKLIKKEFVYSPNFMLDKNNELVDWNNPKEFVEKYIDEETGEKASYSEERFRKASEAVFTLNASKQKLSEKDLKNLRKLDLQIIKNSVFARHGYSFKKPTYRNFFEATDWYIPVSDNVDQQLSSLEKENVALLNRFIKYAEDKYDYFGR